jgi:hypothetical protein
MSEPEPEAATDLLDFVNAMLEMRSSRTMRVGQWCLSHVQGLSKFVLGECDIVSINSPTGIDLDTDLCCRIRWTVFGGDGVACSHGGASAREAGWRTRRMTLDACITPQ